MNLTLRQLRSFIAIADFGSFTRAANAVHLSQPSLTVQIRQLEQSLGVRLLDRNTRSASLTALGRELLPTFRRMLAELDEVITGTRDLAAKKRGIVRLASLPSFAAAILPPAVASFRADYPAIQFVIRDAVGKRIASLLKDGTVEFGITAGRIADPELDATLLMTDRMHALFRHDHPLARRRRITPAMLVDHPMILMDEESTVRQAVNAGFQDAGLTATAALEATYMATAVGMALAGLGVAILPSSAPEARPSELLASRPIQGASFTRQIWLVRRVGRSLTPSAAAFTEHLIQVVKGGETQPA
jgi:DNA-binding transcriptional LysR family regulator